MDTITASITVREFALGPATHEYSTCPAGVGQGEPAQTVKIWAVNGRTADGKITPAWRWVVKHADGTFRLHDERPLFFNVAKEIRSRFGDPQEVHRKVAITATQVRHDPQGQLIGFNARKKDVDSPLDVRVR